MAYKIPTGFDQEAWDWIVADAMRKLDWAKGKRPKVPYEISAKGWRTRKANIEKAKRERKMHLRIKTKENWKQVQEAWRKRGHARLHVMAAMEPGHWYAHQDIEDASGVPSRTIKSLFQFRMSRDELVQKAPNPAWVKIVANKYTAKPRDDREPMYLWSLTETGIAERAKALGELAELGWPKYAPIEKDEL